MSVLPRGKLEILRFKMAQRVYRWSQLSPPWLADAFIHGSERRGRPLEVDLAFPSWRAEEIVVESVLLDPKHISWKLGFAWPDLYAWKLKNVTLDVDSSLVFSRERVIAQSGTGTRSSADAAFISGAYARYRSSAAQQIDHPFAPVGDVQHHYHFMIETLPRLLRIQAINPSTVFYLSSEASAFAANAMKSLNLRVSRLPWGTLLTGQEMYLVNQPLKFWPRLSDVLLVAQALAPLADGPTKAGPNSVYVSRRGSERSLYGEELLEQALTKEGVAVLRLEDLSVEEQLTVVRNSRLLVGAHGAGLVSCVMMAPRGALVELSSGDRFEPCYQRIAELIGLKYSYISIPGRASDPFGVISDEVIHSVRSAVREVQEH